VPKGEFGGDLIQRVEPERNARDSDPTQSFRSLSVAKRGLPRE
jgi:hypothetical protein